MYNLQANEVLIKKVTEINTLNFFTSHLSKLHDRLTWCFRLQEIMFLKVLNLRTQ